jgi:glyoxylase-like metal-dependent hydrolase (beta-lactamase superfamily II)
MTIHPVVLPVHLPAGIAGPEPMDFDVRCFLIPHPTGLVLVDTGLPGTVGAIDAALDQLGATWADVTDIVLSHDHPDHVGGLTEVTARTVDAAVWGNAPLAAREVTDGATVRGLQILQTPGHTAGHVSLLHESGALLVGDLVGTQNGVLVRAPAAFTADPAQAEHSIRRLAAIRASRLMPAHGNEVHQPQHAMDQLINET